MTRRFDRFGYEGPNELIWRKNPARPKPKVTRLPEDEPPPTGAKREQPDTPADAPGSGRGVEE